MWLQAVVMAEKRYLDVRFADAAQCCAFILAHGYGSEVTQQQVEHLVTLAYTLTGEWTPERSLGYPAEMLAKSASEGVSCLPHCWFLFEKVAACAF